MPHYELRDAFGTMYRLSTLDAETAERWFGEWLPRLFGDLPDDYGLPVMSVCALPTEDGHTDWATDSRYYRDLFTIPRDPARALTAIAERRTWIEQQIRAKANDDGK